MCWTWAWSQPEAVSGDEARLLRLAAACGGANLPPARRLEALIAAEAWASATLELLPTGAAYMLSSSPDGHHLATLVLPEWPHEVSAEGPSLALALIGALAEAKLGALAPAAALLNWTRRRIAGLRLASLAARTSPNRREHG